MKVSFIKRRLIRYKYVLREKKAINKMVEKCSQYLMSGWWHVEYENGKNLLKKGAFPKGCSLKEYIRILFFGLYRVNNHQQKAQCNRALSSPFENYKLFDEVNEKVYTMYSERYWDKVELFCSGMLPFFHTEILLEDKENHVLIERYLQNMQTVDEKKCFCFFTEEYKEYLRHIEIGEKKVTPAHIRDVLDSANLPKDVSGYLNHIKKQIRDYDAQYPVILCHNDAHVKNLLTCDNEVFVLIDYELCGENVCFFDFMGLIFNSAVFMGKPLIYNEYMSGAFDDQLAELFEICGMHYDVCDKEQYLFIFLLFRVYLIYVNHPEKLQGYTNRMWNFFDGNGLL